MFNLISILIGLVALILAIPSEIPFLGWGNWIVLPIAGLPAATSASIIVPAYVRGSRCQNCAEP